MNTVDRELAEAMMGSFKKLFDRTDDLLERVEGLERAIAHIVLVAGHNFDVMAAELNIDDLPSVKETPQ